MTLHLEIEAHPQYITVKFTGISKLQDIVGQIARLVARCQQAQVRRCLCELTELHWELSVADRYELGRATRAFGEAGIKLAVVLAPAQLDPQRFGQMVAQNAGTQTCTFAVAAEARAWLLADAPGCNHDF